ncbi:hypothetical protein VCR5J5_1370182 [Vibrio crassostreae]|uniref:Uncharacterized protein n=1 Tax=Vibrio crassostreae TaxID=246167 RepID=A0A822MP42_9VIBR|nr:hypothetical protein VCR5J5_1370182 [Vibrio crassostreae]
MALFSELWLRVWCGYLGHGFMVNHSWTLIRVVVGIAFYQRINRYGRWGMGIQRKCVGS